ncbi:Histidine phosphatase-like protein 2 [Elsinoe fawcettii]|nr:Histidine phosphatase-like protein 2 [Elsinoe fawcettii]
MVLKTLYIVRHGFRSNWVVNPQTGAYSHTFPTPTGIPSDPSLASHGVEQSHDLATRLVYLTPPIGAIYSSPFYRCLQTLAPTVSSLNTSLQSQGKSPLKVRVDTGLGEFYGLARFDHPIPASVEVLHSHFPGVLDEGHRGAIRPSVNGESIPGLHDRVAYALDGIIAQLDAEGVEAAVLCTHAAVMICAGRALTGNMPAEEGVEDFRCGTCAFSRFERRGEAEKGEGKKEWKEGEEVPDLGWRGKGVQGGWECKVNGDCSFLREGEERTWNFAMEDVLAAQQEAATTSEKTRAHDTNRKFSGDESFLNDPDIFNNPGTDSLVEREKAAQRKGSPML